MNAQNRHDLKMLQRHLDSEWERTQHERRAHQVPRKRKTEEIDVDEILDEIEEEEEFDDLDEEDDPTEVKSSRRGRSRKTTKKKATAKKSSGEGGVGTAEVADAAGTDSRSLRVLLRAEFPREEGGRYHWSSLNHPEVKAIIKRVKGGAVKDAKAASLESLKSRRAEKKTTARAPAAKSTAAKKRAAARRKARREAAAAEGDE